MFCHSSVYSKPYQLRSHGLRLKCLCRGQAMWRWPGADKRTRPTRAKKNSRVLFDLRLLAAETFLTAHRSERWIKTGTPDGMFPNSFWIYLMYLSGKEPIERGAKPWRGSTNQVHQSDLLLYNISCVSPLLDCGLWKCCQTVFARAAFHANLFTRRHYLQLVVSSSSWCSAVVFQGTLEHKLKF